MAQRISRAKQTHQGQRRRRSRCRPSTSAPSGCASVLHVLYLIFNEGYTATSGPDLHRSRADARGDPADPRGPAAAAGRRRGGRAARAHAAHRRAPAGAHATRRRAGPARRAGPRPLGRRTDRRGRRARSPTTLPGRPIGPYQLQAAIAAVHDEAARAEDTDWPQIVALYELLERIAPNPMVTLNHAVAVAMVRGPQAGLDLLDHARRRRPASAGHHRLDAVRAHLLEMAGDAAAARAELPDRGAPHDEPARAALPRGARRPARLNRPGRRAASRTP